MDRVEIAWAAGLFEGEGSVMVSNKSLRMKVGMTDHDVILKLHRILKGRVTGPYHRKGQKSNWVWASYGKDALLICELFRPYLGERRTRQIDDCLDKLWCIAMERKMPRKCKICGKLFVPTNPRYASRTFYCSASCKSRVSNGYVAAQLPRTRIAAPKA